MFDTDQLVQLGFRQVLGREWICGIAALEVSEPPKLIILREKWLTIGAAPLRAGRERRATRVFFLRALRLREMGGGVRVFGADS